MKHIILSNVNVRNDHIRAIYPVKTDGKMYEWEIGEGFIDDRFIIEHNLPLLIRRPGVVNNILPVRGYLLSSKMKEDSKGSKIM